MNKRTMLSMLALIVALAPWGFCTSIGPARVHAAASLGIPNQDFDPVTPAVGPVIDTEIDPNAWSMGFYDAANTGYNPAESTLQPPLQALWQAVPSGTETPPNTAPLIVNDRLYFIMADGANSTVYARDLNSGALIWSRAILGTTNGANPVVVGENLYLASRLNAGESGKFYGISTVTGVIIAEAALDGEISSLVADQSKVYLIARDPRLATNHQKIYAFDLSGHEAWKTVTPYTTPPTNPVLVNDRLIFYASPITGIVAAYETEHGNQVWTVPVQDKAVRSTPVGNAAENLVYILEGNNTLKMRALRTDQNGQTAWTRLYPSGSQSMVQPVLAQGVLYHVNQIEDGINLPSAYLYKFNAVTGAPAGTSTIYPTYNGGHYSSMVIANGVLYLTESDSTGNSPLWAFEVEDGTHLWNSPLTDNADAPVAIAQGRLCVNLRDQGYIIYNNVSTYQIGGRIVNQSGVPLQNVTVIATPGSGIQTTTDANGFYTLSGLAANTYNITPVLAGYRFVPISRNVSVPPSAAGQDFIGIRPLQISGYVRDQSNAPLSGVKITADLIQSPTELEPLIAYTDEEGWYQLTTSVNGTYLLTPTLTGYSFQPTLRQITVPPDATEQNFTGTLGLFDLPVTYTDFAQAARGNAGPNPGLVINWFDHSYPDYTANLDLTRWDGAFFEFREELCGKGASCYDGHDGTDFAQTPDGLVLAAAPGRVVEVVTDCKDLDQTCGHGYGNQVWIDHGNGYLTLYGYLQMVDVTAGTLITSRTGQPLGSMGHTGRSTEISVHFGVYRDNNGNGLGDPEEVVDPYGWTATTPDPWGTASGYLWLYPLDGGNE